jgi:hypothetical protein
MLLKCFKKVSHFRVNIRTWDFVADGQCTDHSKVMFRYPIFQFPISLVNELILQGQSRSCNFLLRSWTVGVLRCHLYVNYISTCFGLIRPSSGRYFYVIPALYSFFYFIFLNLVTRNTKYQLIKETRNRICLNKIQQ